MGTSSLEQQKQEYKYFITQSGDLWDPDFGSTEQQQKQVVSNACLMRINKDLRALYDDPAPGICVIPSDEDVTKVFALITGPFDTPYEGGFFLFQIRFSPDYPLRPPKVKLMTTGNGTVRFNPNLYKNGKVCLSILGTWTGPEWSPAQSLWSVLLSIQSLLNDQPYHNEPGFRYEHSPGDAKRYNTIIAHETIRCAVCDILEGRAWCPPDLFLVIQSGFEDYYDHYVRTCEQNMSLNVQPMADPFGERRGSFDYVNLLRRLEAIHSRLDSNDLQSSAVMDCSSSDP